MKFDVLSLEQKVDLILSNGNWCGYRNHDNITYSLYAYNGFFVEMAMDEHLNCFCCVDRIRRNIVFFLSTDERSLRYEIL